MLAMPKEMRTSKSRRLSIPTAAAAAGPTRNTPCWTPEDDEQLIQARASGKNWNEIAPTYFKSKTPNACRKRHERLMEKRNAEQWDGVKLETLAKAYFEVNEQMWRILAERLGEPKWAVVEQKCMEKGLKNLNQAARSARKKGTFNEHHDDSGISCSDPKESLDERHGDHLLPHPYQGSNNINFQQREPTIESMLSGPAYNPHPHPHHQ